LLFSDDAGNSVIEYCNGETFKPRCHGNDVIVMLSARYGRMKIGRCITRNPGLEPMLQDPRYLGCSVNVLDIVSRVCSGRKECSLRVVDQNFDNIKPCYDTMKMHLEAAFMCINGKHRRNFRGAGVRIPTFWSGETDPHFISTPQAWSPTFQTKVTPLTVSLMHE